VDWILLVAVSLISITLIVGIVFWLVFRPRELLRTVQMLTKQVHELSDELRKVEKRERLERRKLEAEAAANRGEIRQLETRIYDAVRLISRLLEGISSLSAQIEDAGDVPNFEVPTDAKLLLAQKPEARGQSPEQKLAHLFGSKFLDDELRTVALDLDASLDYENLPGSIKEARAQSLVRWAAHRNRLDDLAKIGKKYRPLDDWSI
jgi:hypothetical protein